MPPRILVADHDHDGADSLALLLRFEGYDVKTAYDRAESLELVESFKPQVALLDIGLPGSDGYAVAQRVQERKSGIVLVGVSGWARRIDEQRAHEAGFAYYFVKPIEIERLQKLLSALTQAIPQSS